MTKKHSSVPLDMSHVPMAENRCATSLRQFVIIWFRIFFLYKESVIKFFSGFCQTQQTIQARSGLCDQVRPLILNILTLFRTGQLS